MAFTELKSKQSVVWGAGPYQRITDNLTDAHDHLLVTTPPVRDEDWLDIATGTGAVAIRAAAGGADVVAQDLAPELISRAILNSEDAGVLVDYRTGDCEDLPFDDASFDTVSSAFGHMFSPDHKASADEIARITRPGGSIALLTWHPTQGVAELFKILSGYQPPRPEGVGNPFDWGDTTYVSGLLGDNFDLEFHHGISTHKAINADALWREFREDYGPTKVLADSLDDAERAELAEECIRYFASFPEGEHVAWTRPYLLTVGTRR